MQQNHIQIEGVKYLTTWQAADRFDVTTQSVRNWIRKDDFPNTIEISTSPDGLKYVFLIPMSDIASFAKAHGF